MKPAGTAEAKLARWPASRFARPLDVNDCVLFILPSTPRINGAASAMRELAELELMPLKLEIAENSEPVLPPRRVPRIPLPCERALTVPGPPENRPERLLRMLPSVP